MWFKVEDFEVEPAVRRLSTQRPFSRGAAVGKKVARAYLTPVEQLKTPPKGSRNEIRARPLRRWAKRERAIETGGLQLPHPRAALR